MKVRVPVLLRVCHCYFHPEHVCTVFFNDKLHGNQPAWQNGECEQNRIGRLTHLILTAGWKTSEHWAKVRLPLALQHADTYYNVQKFRVAPSVLFGKDATDDVDNEEERARSKVVVLVVGVTSSLLPDLRWCVEQEWPINLLIADQSYEMMLGRELSELYAMRKVCHCICLADKF